jgi:hypothetical protein
VSVTTHKHADLATSFSLTQVSHTASAVIGFVPAAESQHRSLRPAIYVVRPVHGVSLNSFTPSSSDIHTSME